MAGADNRGLRSPSKTKSPPFTPGYSLRGCICFIITFLVLVVLQNQLTKRPLILLPPPSPWAMLHQWEQALGADGSDCARRLDDATSRLRDVVTFLPLKDPRLLDKPLDGTTWFMSSLNDTYEGEDSQHLRFPSAASKGRLLCLAGNHTSDGTQNAYALAWPDALPPGAALLPGLTYVSDTYYDYKNLWHGLQAMMPFFGWHLSRGCAPPARWVLYLRGELRTSTAVSYWVRMLTEVALGQELRTEDFAASGGRPTCFEEAVVFRHNQGAMSTRKKREVYALLRCKARAFCNFTKEEDAEQKGAPLIRITLLLRTGTRSFKNESAVIDIFRRACANFEGCRFTVAWANKLETFCDQVKTLSATDVLLSPHGAQLTNMFFMDQNSSVMEMFPKGWDDKLAGPGKYVFSWLAGDSGMRHQGVWMDPDGVACPFPEMERSRCFSRYFKNSQLGHDEAHFANWTSAVLGQVREHKLRETAVGGEQPRRRQPAGCACGYQARSAD